MGVDWLIVVTLQTSHVKICLILTGFVIFGELFLIIKRDREFTDQPVWHVNSCQMLYLWNKFYTSTYWPTRLVDLSNWSYFIDLRYSYKLCETWTFIKYILHLLYVFICWPSTNWKLWPKHDPNKCQDDPRVKYIFNPKS